MRIYILSGYAPDPAEQSVCTLAEVYTDESIARERFNEIKKDVEYLLEDNYENGRLEYYSIDCTEVKHNKFTLGGLVAKASIAPGNEKHQDMWRDWSTASIGTGCCCVSPNEMSLNLKRSTDFNVASIDLRIKEINV